MSAPLPTSLPVPAATAAPAPAPTAPPPMNDVEAATQRAGVGDLDRDQPMLADVARDREVRQERESNAALHHALGGLDRLDFHHHVRNESGRAEQSLRQRPVARAAIE